MYYIGRKFFILLGLVWGIFGILVIINPAWYSSYLKKYVDLTVVKWQVGGFFIVLGAIFIGSSFRRGAFEAEKEYKEMQKVLMCPRCVKPHLKKNVLELKCPVSGEILEDLTGFYEKASRSKINEHSKRFHIRSGYAGVFSECLCKSMFITFPNSV